ncbi:MAG TPA: sensor histidine kinase [Candidatus Nitrosotenuis sp.]|nr:sensor histidine kinase [Candidatus Nitrosotenuis sp.]
MMLIFIALTSSYLVASFVSVEIIQKQITDTIGLYSVQSTKSTLTNMYHRIDVRTNELLSVVKDDEIINFIKNSNSDFDKMTDRDSYINNLDQDWSSGKDLPVISNILSNSLSQHLQNTQNHLRTYDDQLAFAEIFITNKHGVIVGSTDRTSDYLQSDEDWYMGALSEKDHAWLGQPEYDESAKTYSIDIVATIKDKSGNFIGEVKGVLNLDNLSNDLVELQKNIPYQNTPYLVDEDGYSILSVDSSNLSSFKSDTKLRDFGTNLSDQEPVKVALEKDSGFLLWSDGTSDKFTTYATMPKVSYPEKLGWILLLDFNKSEIMAPLTNLYSIILVIGIIITSVSAVVGYCFSRTISNPLEALSVAANNMGRGNLDQQVTVRSKDEIGKLCQSFNTMSVDVKRKIELEKELAVAQKQVKDEKLLAIGELASRLSHDLRNPLHIIRNTVSLIKHDLGNNLKQVIREDFDRIDRSIVRMTHQIESVMDFISTRPLMLTSNSIQKIIRDAIEKIRVPETVTINLPSDDVEAIGDTKQLEVVFDNLLLNAVQAMNGAGVINIRIFKDRETFRVEIEDTGPDIPSEVLPKLFEPLFTTKQEGTGLGLASCKNIIEKHGGTITVRVKPTTFIVTLPYSVSQDGVVGKSMGESQIVKKRN